jgi:hypothetical protein
VPVVPLDGEDCPYAASERAWTTAIDSAANRSSRDPPMSLTHLLMFAASLMSLILSHSTVCLELYDSAATGSLRIVHCPREKITVAELLEDEFLDFPLAI